MSDSHRRAIYDTVGLKGLQTDGWEMVQRTKTPAEIRAEFEKLAEEREEVKRMQQTNPRGTVTIDVNATDLFNPYMGDYDEEYELYVMRLTFSRGRIWCYFFREPNFFPNIEVSGMTFNQSVEIPITQKDHCTLAGQLQTHNGTGNGAVNMSWRHIYSHKSWSELDISAGKLIFTFRIKFN